MITYQAYDNIKNQSIYGRCFFQTFNKFVSETDIINMEKELNNKKNVSNLCVQGIFQVMNES